MSFLGFPENPKFSLRRFTPCVNWCELKLPLFSVSQELSKYLNLHHFCRLLPILQGSLSPALGFGRQGVLKSGGLWASHVGCQPPRESYAFSRSARGDRERAGLPPPADQHHDGQAPTPLDGANGFGGHPPGSKTNGAGRVSLIENTLGFQKER